ncbi:MAG: O-methyltransferase [Acidobacteria bacterium]|nr:O-methyltransferase [Acidobacteriota bacterium]
MITNPDIERYIAGLLPPRDEVLAEMEDLAAERNIPILGPVVGRILAQYVMLAGASRIFELGSAIGYSTIWLARAAGPDAEVHYSDGSAENASIARSFFQRAGVADRVRIHVGDALTALAGTAGEFDLIFNDVDKEGYPAVLEAAVARLRPGGVLVTDNTLWHARVLDPQDDTTRAVVDFNRKIFARGDLWSCLVPVRDGIVVAQKVR